MEETMIVVTAESKGRPSTIRPADRRVHGKRLRDTAPRDAHAAWRGHAERADPIGILHAADATRQPDLVPLDRRGAARALSAGRAAVRRRFRPFGGGRDHGSQLKTEIGIVVAFISGPDRSP
jgi:hypothetical protein